MVNSKVKESRIKVCQDSRRALNENMVGKIDRESYIHHKIHGVM